MMNIKHLIVAALLFNIGCKTTENTESAEKMSENNQTEIISVEIEAITRGQRENISISQKNYEYKSTTEKISKEMSPEQWQQLVAEINAVQLKNLSSFDAPTDKRFYDGDMATTITVSTKDSIYRSQSFDKKTPPNELKKIMDIGYGFKE